MFHNRTLNHKINRLVYQNENLTFQELLDKDNSVTTHHKNLQKLATEMYKIKNHLSPLPMQELFTEKVNNHDLRNKRSWVTCNVRTVKYGTETKGTWGPKPGNLYLLKSRNPTPYLNLRKELKGGNQVDAHVDCAKHTFIILSIFTVFLVWFYSWI